METCETALLMEDLEKVQELVTEVRGWRPGEVSPYLLAQMQRFGARADAARGGDPSTGMRSAIRTFQGLSMPFWAAAASLELAEWLLAQGRETEAAPLAAEARATFEQLRPTPWLERLDASGALDALAQAT
ncbi:MAG: hypothetical protein ACXVQW_02880 [Actinomycetota bacterium]